MTKKFITVYNLVSDLTAEFEAGNPEHALRYCEAERVGLRSWYLARYHDKKTVEIEQRFPIIVGEKTIACGDFTTLLNPPEEPEELTYRILSIDAWRNSDGWDWNNWHPVGGITPDATNWTPRKILKYFRDEGYLADASAGKCTVEDDGYNLLILEKSNRRPLYAIEYGNHDH